MGLKLTNIQLFVGDNRSPAEVQTRTIEALNNWLTERDFVPLSLDDTAIIELLEPQLSPDGETGTYPDRPFSRSAAVGFAQPDSRWVALYDQSPNFKHGCTIAHLRLTVNRPT
jgi:hypothetical protein